MLDLLVGVMKVAAGVAIFAGANAILTALLYSMFPWKDDEERNWQLLLVASWIAGGFLALLMYSRSAPGGF